MEDCPSCGSKLEKGFIAGFWTRKRGEIPVTRLGWHEAYRCRQCDLVLFYSRPLSREQLLDTVPTIDMSYILKKKEPTPSETKHTPKRQKKTKMVKT